MQYEAGQGAETSVDQDAPLHIYLLGPLRIERNGVPLRLPRRKVEALLAYLLLHPEPHSRDLLATLFWGDTSDEKARHSLRTGLATLRQQLGADLLLADRDRVQLNAEYPIWVDLHELLAISKNLNSGNLTRPGWLDSMLALWQTNLLEGFYEDWVSAEREHYQARLIKLFLKVTHALRSQSEYTQAIKVAQQILRFEPANEAAHQHLMFCYVATGDRAAALRQYELCEQALLADLDAPPLAETTALYHWIKQQEGAETAIVAKITNLPIPLTSFVGRSQPMSEIKLLLDPVGNRTRLLTLTGAGGSGKTRLAIQSATDLIDSFAHGVWWVELAALNEGEQVARAVAKALGVNEVAHEACLQTVSHFLGDKHLLLVLDNCEHLIEASAEVTTSLLGSCPKLQILVTSRESLNVAGEVVWQVPTFALPEPQQISLLDILLQYECIRLFYERASAIQPGFRLTLENAPSVIQICTHLDGIPLAIELAAARVKVLPVEQIATRLSSAIGARFTLLTQGSRNLQPRQQTLHAAIDWSYDLLDTNERQLFRTLAVFRGGFTLEALEAIVDCTLQRVPILGADSQGDTPHSTTRNSQFALRNLDLLTQLVDKSLVMVETQVGQGRYRLLETLREYALEHFPDPHEFQALQHCHAGFFTEWAEQAAPHLIALQQQDWLNRFEMEHANLRAALEFSLAWRETESALRLGIALSRFWGTRGYVSEGREWFQKILMLCRGLVSGRVARTCNDAGFLAFRQGDFDQALAYYRQGLELFQHMEEEIGIVDVLQNMALWAIHQGKFDMAQDHLQQSLELSRSLDYPYGLARAAQHLGNLAYDQDKIVEARRYFEASLALYRSIGDQVNIANLLLNIGNTFTQTDDAVSAYSYHQECLTISRAIGHNGLIGTVLRNLGLHALTQKNYAQARSYAEESIHIMQQLGDKSNTGFAVMCMGEVAQAQGEHTQALSCYAQALSIMVDLNYRWPIFNALEFAAHLLIEIRQHPTVAAHCLAAAAAVRRELGSTVVESEQARHEQRLAELKQQLGTLAFEQDWQDGEQLPLDQIVQEVKALTIL